MVRKLGELPNFFDVQLWDSFITELLRFRFSPYYCSLYKDFSSLFFLYDQLGA
jgi:hypothetical protein